MPADPLAPLAALPGVAAAADGARRAVDRLLTHQAMRRHGAEVSAEAALRCARASAALDGVDVPLARLRARPPADPIAQGALRLAAELRALVPAMERSPAQALARMHVLAGAGALPDERLGRPRLAGEQPLDDPLGLGAAPDAGAIGPRLAALGHAITTASAAVPATVVAAIVHGELLALRPFGSGNGLVARAAARTVLVSRGFDPRAASAPDVGCLQQRSTYADALRGYATGSDVAGWVVWCARAIEHGAVEGVAICEALLRQQ